MHHSFCNPLGAAYEYTAGDGRARLRVGREGGLGGQVLGAAEGSRGDGGKDVARGGAKERGSGRGARPGRMRRGVDDKNICCQEARVEPTHKAGEAQQINRVSPA